MGESYTSHERCNHALGRGDERSVQVTEAPLDVSLTAPFPTACIGMQLAKIEVVLGATTFFRECPTAKIAPTTTDEDMEFVNHFLIAPKHHKCEIIL